MTLESSLGVATRSPCKETTTSIFSKYYLSRTLPHRHQKVSSASSHAGKRDWSHFSLGFGQDGLFGTNSLRPHSPLIFNTIQALNCLLDCQHASSSLISLSELKFYNRVQSTHASPAITINHERLFQNLDNFFIRLPM